MLFPLLYLTDSLNFNIKAPMKRFFKIMLPLAIMVNLFFFCPEYAFGQSEGFRWPETNYEGEWSSSSTLSGDWGGRRTSLADKGFILNIDTTGTFQGIINGGFKEKNAFGGSADYELRMSLEKMGLWWGSFIRIYAKTRYGEFINEYTGAITAANADGLFPAPDENTTELMSATYYQYVLKNLGIYFGKLDTLDRDTNAFAGGKGKTNFLNQNFIFNQVTAVTVPASALGAGIFFLYPDNEDVFTLSVMDANGKPGKTDFDQAFDDGISFMMEYRMQWKPLGLRAHQLFGVSYGTNTILDDAPWLEDLDIELPVEIEGNRDDSWSIYYNYDQLLYHEKNDARQGLGYFIRLGIADKKSNPIDFFYSFGVSGTGVIPGRDRDTFGIGYYYTGISDDLLDQTDLLRNIEGCELFYNFEVTPWLHITPDFQVFETGYKNLSTDIVGGVRVKIDI
jgi:porin